MVELEFGIAAYAAWNPQSGTQTDFHWSSEGDADHDRPARPPVPQLLRRRVTPIGQAALRVAWALPQVERARFVFASRHGEFDRTMTMLDQLAAEDGPSPADFSLGVHNALAGLLSICARNHGGHTALAAGVDSFGFGLMEATACLIDRPEDPVMLVYYDAGLPTDYPDTAPACAEATLALALALVPQSETSKRVVMTAIPSADADPGEAAAAVFLRFLGTTVWDASAIGVGEVGATAIGARMVWHWRHV